MPIQCNTLPRGLSFVTVASRRDLWDRSQNDPIRNICTWTSLDRRNPWFWFIDQLEEIPELASYQTMIVRDEDEEVVAYGQCVPFYWPELAELPATLPENLDWALSLPDGGWETVLARGVRQTIARQGGDPSALPIPLHEVLAKDNGIALCPDVPNAISGLGIVVSKKYRRMGLAEILLDNFKALARKNNLRALVVPVRPTFKSDYPDASYSEYLSWTEGKPYEPGFTWTLDKKAAVDGPLPFDPWVRKHVKLGARVVKLAPQSTIIEGTAQQWRELIAKTGAPDVFVDENGQEKVDGGKLHGVFVSDLWMIHPL